MAENEEDKKFAKPNSFDFKAHYVQKRRKTRNSDAETIFQTSASEDFILFNSKTFTVQG